MVDPEILDHYGGGDEENRLTRSAGRLEWLRTWEIMQRYLPPGSARILDAGGGAGTYALPLSAQGHRVHLLDAVPLHVERARTLSSASATPLVSADVGDARRLEYADETFDAVLLLGPLYHLIDRGDRNAALAEARRVLVRGGLLMCAYISRFASALDGILGGNLRDETFAGIVGRDLANGIHLNPTRRPDWFTTAYFHRPDEVRPEIEEAGLIFEQLIAVEGPGWLHGELDGLDAWLADDPQRERLLEILRRVETEASLLGASAHMVSVARRPGQTGGR
jgi:SAM-dependent methyltransferase